MCWQQLLGKNLHSNFQLTLILHRHRGDGDDDDGGGGDDGDGGGDDDDVVVVMVTCQRMDVLDQLFSRGHGTVD